MSPFEALYGRKPPTVLDYTKGQSTIADLDKTLQQRQQIITTLKENLQRTRKQMQDQANKKRRECTFQPGDLVLLRLQPYRQQTVHQRASPKLAKSYYGPFLVVRRIKEVSYELQLPQTFRIHPVIHVSQLRAYYGHDPEVHFKPIPPGLEESVLLDSMKTSKPSPTTTLTKEDTGAETLDPTTKVSKETLQNFLDSPLKNSSDLFQTTLPLSNTLALSHPSDQIYTSPKKPSTVDSSATFVKSAIYPSLEEIKGPLSNFQSHTPDDTTLPTNQSNGHISPPQPTLEPNLEVKVA